MTDYIGKALGEAQEVTPREWLKSCGCGANYSYTSWNALPLLGVTEMEPDENNESSWLEQKNCSACGSTLAVEWGQEENAHHWGENGSCNAGMGGDSCVKCEKEQKDWWDSFGPPPTKQQLAEHFKTEEEINQDLRDSGRGHLASDK